MIGLVRRTALYCYVLAPFWDVSSPECLRVVEQSSLFVPEPTFTTGTILIRQQVGTEREREGKGG